MRALSERENDLVINANRIPYYTLFCELPKKIVPRPDSWDYAEGLEETVRRENMGRDARTGSGRAHECEK